MNEILSISGAALICAALIILIKQYKPEFGFSVSVIATVIIFSFILPNLSDVISYVSEIAGISAVTEDNFKIMLKCLGICVITKLTSDACRDCGQEALSSKAEMAGKVIVISISIPLFSELLKIIESVLTL